MISHPVTITILRESSVKSLLRAEEAAAAAAAGPSSSEVVAGAGTSDVGEATPVVSSTPATPAPADSRVQASRAKEAKSRDRVIDKCAKEWRE